MAVIAGGNPIVPDNRRGSCYVKNLIATTNLTSSGESDWMTDCSKFTSCIIHVKVANTSGTSQTLDVKFQQRSADGSTAYDIAAMTQINANGSYIQSFVGGAAVGFTATDKTLAAGTVKAVPLGGATRIALVVGGTAHFDVNVSIEFIQ